MAKKPSASDLKKRAAEIGLDKLEPAHLEELARAVASMERMVESLPKEVVLADEPAHVFRAGEDA
ncbi:MAG: hypothetical protein QF654_04440 [Alphaproteobacteria bacterium]|jgi:hypothetical protein|nr:hypothetical protein [Alphaproteobacteria bacterium]